MAIVTADYQERKRIVFDARGRTQVNVREAAGDGPIGFTSTELMLIAIGNCMLGTLLAMPILAEIEIPHALASMEATMASEPPRIVRIDVDIELQSEDAALGEIVQELEQAACNCPMCNSLTAERVVHIRVTTPQTAA